MTSTDFFARLRAAIMRSTGFARRTSMDSRLAEELRFHVEMSAERNRRGGFDDVEAERLAHVSLGGRSLWAESARDEYRSRLIEDFLQDLRYAVRTLRSAPAFTIAAILTLALGIGANTAIFSAVDGVLFKPLPFSHPERIVRVYQNDVVHGLPRSAVAPGNFAEWHARASAFAGIAVAEPFGLVYSGPEGEEEIRDWQVTRDFFTVLDARPILGRVFGAADYEPGAPATVILTYASWQTRFGSDPTIVGRRLRIDHKPTTVVGVLPRDFSYLGTRTPQELYVPKVLDTLELRLRGSAWYNAVARLKPGVSVTQGGADLNRVASQLAREYPETNSRIGATVVRLRDGMTGDSTHALFLLLGASLVLLLIACTNVANLMLARTNRRAREFVVRTVLGAARARVARQVLTEGLVLAFAGALAGVAVAYWGVGIIRGLTPDSIPRADEIRVDWRALAFALVAVPGATILFALAPAIRAAGPELESDFKAGTRSSGRTGQRRTRSLLIGAEVALAVVLLVSAGLLVRSFASVVNQDRGYESDHVIGATMFIWEWETTPDARRAFVERLLRRARALPGVESAGITTSPPLAGSIGVDQGPYTVVGRVTPVDQRPMAHLAAMSPEAFDVLHMRLARGRRFTQDDNASSANVVLVNESLAREAWPNENPIGKRLGTRFYASQNSEREVIGVVTDTRQAALDAPPTPTIYMPHAQEPSGSMWLVVSTRLEPAALTHDLKRMVAELNPALPVATIQSFDDIVSDSLRPRRFALTLFATFAAAALVLAMVGVYGVTSNAVAERSRELGVRIALGARGADILRLVMREGAAAAGAGVLAGALLSAATSRLLGRMLFGVTPLDSVTYGAVVVAMIGTVMLACFVPARRATRADPLEALRQG
jgi:putative ABC transport system permease protein